MLNLRKLNFTSFLQIWFTFAILIFFLSLSLFINKVNSATEDSFAYYFEDAQSCYTNQPGGSWCSRTDSCDSCSSGLCCSCGKCSDGGSCAVCDPPPVNNNPAPPSNNTTQPDLSPAPPSVDTPSSCRTNQQAGEGCDPSCGDLNNCDGGGSMGCYTCPGSTVKSGQNVCSRGGATAQFTADCGGAKNSSSQNSTNNTSNNTSTAPTTKPAPSTNTTTTTPATTSDLIDCTDINNIRNTCISGAETGYVNSVNFCGSNSNIFKCCPNNQLVYGCPQGGGICVSNSAEGEAFCALDLSATNRSNLSDTCGSLDVINSTVCASGVVSGAQFSCTIDNGSTYSCCPAGKFLLSDVYGSSYCSDSTIPVTYNSADSASQNLANISTNCIGEVNGTETVDISDLNVILPNPNLISLPSLSCLTQNVNSNCRCTK